MDEALMCSNKHSRKMSGFSDHSGHTMLSEKFDQEDDEDVTFKVRYNMSKDKK
jgi:hypothetical protein